MFLCRCAMVAYSSLFAIIPETGPNPRARNRQDWFRSRLDAWNRFLIVSAILLFSGTAAYDRRSVLAYTRPVPQCQACSVGGRLGHLVPSPFCRTEEIRLGRRERCQELVVGFWGRVGKGEGRRAKGEGQRAKGEGQRAKGKGVYFVLRSSEITLQ